MPLTQPDDERVTANAIGKAVILRDEQSSGVRAVPTHGTGNYKAKVRVQLEVCQNAVRWWLAAQIETDGTLGQGHGIIWINRTMHTRRQTPANANERQNGRGGSAAISLLRIRRKPMRHVLLMNETPHGAALDDDVVWCGVVRTLREQRAGK